MPWPLMLYCDSEGSTYPAPALLVFWALATTATHSAVYPICPVVAILPAILSAPTEPRDIPHLSNGLPPCIIPGQDARGSPQPRTDFETNK